MFNFDKTMVALRKLANDVKRLTDWFDNLLQVYFLAYYCYAIYSNQGRPALIVTNSILLAVSLGYFVYRIVGKLREKKFSKQTRRTVRRGVATFKMCIKTFTVALALYDLFSFEHTTTKTVLTVISVVGFVVNILMELIRRYLENYVDLLVYAFKMDIAEMQDNKVVKAITNITNPKTAFINMIDKPFAAMAARKADDDDFEQEDPLEHLTAKEKSMHQYLTEHADMRSEIEQEQKLLKKQQKRDKKRQRLADAKARLKQNFKLAFRRKPKQKKPKEVKDEQPLQLPPPEE